MENNTKNAAHLWTLICCLNTAKYCLRELAPAVPKNTHTARKMKDLNKTASAFMKHGQRHATASERELLESLSHENVAAIAETVAIISGIPPDSIDWFCDRVNHIAKGIILGNENENK